MFCRPTFCVHNHVFLFVDNSFCPKSNLINLTWMTRFLSYHRYERNMKARKKYLLKQREIVFVCLTEGPGYVAEPKWKAGREWVYVRERDKEKRCLRLRVQPRFPAAMDRRDTLGWLRLQGGGGGRHVALLGRGRQTQTPGLPHLAHHLHVHPSHPVSGNNLELLVKRKEGNVFMILNMSYTVAHL